MLKAPSLPCGLPKMIISLIRIELQVAIRLNTNKRKFTIGLSYILGWPRLGQSRQINMLGVPYPKQAKLGAWSFVKRSSKVYSKNSNNFNCSLGYGWVLGSPTEKITRPSLVHVVINYHVRKMLRQ